MCNHLVFDTPDVSMSFTHGYNIPIFAFAPRIIPSRFVYGHRIEFPLAHKYRYQMKELASVLTSFAYSRSVTNELAKQMLSQMQDSLLRDIRKKLDTPYEVDNLQNFIADNYLFIHKHGSVTFFGKTFAIVTDNLGPTEVRDAIKDILISTYVNVLHDYEVEYITSGLMVVISNISFK